jgi:hypothetical protein
MDLQTNFDHLITNVATCDPRLSGCNINLINFDPVNGIIPRCLYLERREANQPGAIIIGANPSKAPSEREAIGNALIDRENGYKRWVKNFEEYVLNSYCYFTGGRGLAEAAGIKGDILWTEIYKCENIIRSKKSKEEKSGEDGKPHSQNGSFHLQVAETCTERHLLGELKFFHNSHDIYTIFALGHKTFEFLSEKYNNCEEWKPYLSNLIGVYHPSGAYSRGYFEDLFVPRKDYKFLSSIETMLAKKKGPTFLKIDHNK